LERCAAETTSSHSPSARMMIPPIAGGEHPLSVLTSVDPIAFDSEQPQPGTSSAAIPSTPIARGACLRRRVFKRVAMLQNSCSILSHVRSGQFRVRWRAYDILISPLRARGCDPRSGRLFRDGPDWHARARTRGVRVGVSRQSESHVATCGGSSRGCAPASWGSRDVRAPRVWG
jgi:hypothetical protein